MTVALFFIDMIKGLVLSLILGIPFLWGLLWLMEQMGTYWWVWAWIATVVFSLFIQLLYPTLIAPLFNKFEPIENPQIQSKIMALANRCHFKLGGIFVMDGSKRSGHGNAYFTGFGGNKRIVFYDTLINSLTPDEVEAVLAHELGHYKLKHIIKMLVVGVLLALIQFAILGYLKEQPWFYSGLGVSPSMQPTLANAQALLLFFMVMPLFTFFVTPLSSIFSRKHEFEADDFAAQNSNKADLITALVKMYEDNASTLTPDPVYSKIFYSHPPAFERITHLQSAGRGDVAHSAEEGLVIASFGQHALVRLSAEVQIPCTQKGKKNAVVTGDWVQVEVDGEQGQIVTILPRRNLFYRSDLFKQKSFAANIDQIFYVVACEPYFDVDLLGRAAIAAESAHINFVIILNKSDLTPLLPLARERLAQYVLWYPLVQTTTQITALSLQQQFSTLLEGQTTLLLG
ncbi:unnamed protein product, partial [Darwinula stevensoni]